ncbi:MAG: bL21 family ribosomal protein [Planctomycetota bacterium]
MHLFRCDALPSPCSPIEGPRQYAVIEDSGSQIRVAEGDVVTLDKRGLAEDQAELTLDKVLLVGGTDEAALIAACLGSIRLIDNLPLPV